MCASTPACAQGDTVTPFYDPMIAKLIVHDRDRTSALRRMAALMGETEVVGVTTNVALLKALCSHPAFVGGEVDTGFIERHRDDAVRQAARRPTTARFAVADPGAAGRMAEARRRARRRSVRRGTDRTASGCSRRATTRCAGRTASARSR